jgi:prepilin-type processing-associated H-X9-DG protein
MNTGSANMSGGLDSSLDLVFPAQPADARMRESVSVWLFEEGGAFGFPRMGVEAEASSWTDRLLQANFAFADGRVLNGAGRGPAPSAFGRDGRPTILGAGSIAFECLEPFRRWSLSFDGPAVDTHVSQQIHRKVDPGRRTHVKLAAEMVMAVPAWSQQTSQEELATMAHSAAAEAGFMGTGYRFEQLFRARGMLTIDGQTREFTGSGLRIHRQSIRELTGFRGHCWQSAVFPDGRAFGYIAYPPADDGPPPYNEGYIFQDGRMYAARASQPPWLRRVIARDDDVGLELVSELGRTRIEGATTLSTFRIGNPDIGGLNLQQSGVRYRWGGQTALGMIERSSHESLTTIELG